MFSCISLYFCFYSWWVFYSPFVACTRKLYTKRCWLEVVVESCIVRSVSFAVVAQMMSGQNRCMSVRFNGGNLTAILLSLTSFCVTLMCHEIALLLLYVICEVGSGGWKKITVVFSFWELFYTVIAEVTWKISKLVVFCTS